MKKWEPTVKEGGNEVYMRLWIVPPQWLLAYSAFLVVGFNALVVLKDDWMLPMATLQVPLAFAYMHLAYMIYYHRLEASPRHVTWLWVLKTTADVSGLAVHVYRFKTDYHHAELAFLLTFIAFDFFAGYWIAKMTKVILKRTAKQITKQVSSAHDLTTIQIQSHKEAKAADLVDAVQAKQFSMNPFQVAERVRGLSGSGAALKKGKERAQVVSESLRPLLGKNPI